VGAEVLVFIRCLTVFALLHELQVRKGRFTRAFFFTVVDQIPEKNGVQRALFDTHCIVGSLATGQMVDGFIARNVSSF
jgi:hypothetical protein